MEEPSQTMQENQNNLSDEEEEPEGERVCRCVVLREGYSLAQFLGMLLLTFSTFYAMITSSFFLVLLLPSQEYFHLAEDATGTALSSIILSTEILNIAVYLVIGLIYDLVGRKPILVIG